MSILTSVRTWWAKRQQHKHEGYGSGDKLEQFRDKAARERNPPPPTPGGI
jgi:hypothetical protein